MADPTHLRRVIFGWDDVPREVGPVEAPDHAFGPPEVERGDDVLADTGRRGGSERHDRRVHPVPDQADAPVVRPKVVAPFGDAMRFVHGDEGDPAASQHLAKGGYRKALGRHQQELEVAARDVVQHPPPGWGVLR